MPAQEAGEWRPSSRFELPRGRAMAYCFEPEVFVIWIQA